MNDPIVTTFIGITAGAAGYWIANFWMRPILRFYEIRQQVLSDMLFFANAVIADGMSDKIKDACLKRIEANRRHSADLTACYEVLPSWYKKMTRLDVESAARNLMGYANTPNYEDAVKRTNAIKKALGFTTEVI